MQHELGYISVRLINSHAAAALFREMKLASTPFEIPNELRDFAERSVDQARKAFEGFVTVAQKTVGTVDGVASNTQTGVKTVSSQILGYAEQNVNAAFDLAHKLVQAKDPQEALAVQTEYLKAQLNSLQTQAKELGALIQKSATGGSK
jgi:phasin